MLDRDAKAHKHLLRTHFEKFARNDKILRLISHKFSLFPKRKEAIYAVFVVISCLLYNYITLMLDCPLFICNRQIKPEISSSVIIRNITYHRTDKLKIVGHKSASHIISQYIAKQSAKIFMARIA